jgi:hypothetical protein
MADEPIEVIPENVAQQVLGAEPTVEPKEELEVKPAEEESRYQKRIDQLTRARREAEERAIRAEERARMMEQQRFAAPSTPAVTEDKIGEMTREKWEEWHAENPVDAMRYLSRAEGRAEAEKVKAETMTQIGRASAVQETISSVYKAHPELQDVMEGRKTAEEVPFWQVYDEVARDPEFADCKFLVKGAKIVMREAERRVKEKDMAERERKISGDAAVKEKDRQDQVNAGHTAGSSPRPPSAGSVKLSPEEERIARKMGMSPEEYAKNKGGT